MDAPWAAPSARRVGRPDARDLDRGEQHEPALPAPRPVATRPIFGAEPRELSLLFVLFYIAASGNENNPGTFERNFNTRDGAQMFRFVRRLPADRDRLARRLGSRVLLRSPVRRIVQAAAASRSTPTLDGEGASG